MQGSYDSEEVDEHEEMTDLILASGNENANDVQMNCLRKNNNLKKKSMEKNGVINEDGISFSDDTDDYSTNEYEPLKELDGSACK